MPALILWLGEALAALGGWLGEFLGAGGLGGGIAGAYRAVAAWASRNAIIAWLILAFSSGTAKTVVRALIVVTLMAAYGIFTLLFWTYASGAGFQEIFNTAPFGGVPGAVLYLVSYLFL